MGHITPPYSFPGQKPSANRQWQTAFRLWLAVQINQRTDETCKIQFKCLVVQLMDKKMDRKCGFLASLGFKSKNHYCYVPSSTLIHEKFVQITNSNVLSFV